MKTILVDDMPLDMKLLEVKCKGIKDIILVLKATRFIGLLRIVCF